MYKTLLTVFSSLLLVSGAYAYTMSFLGDAEQSDDDLGCIEYCKSLNDGIYCVAIVNPSSDEKEVLHVRVRHPEYGEDHEIFGRGTCFSVDSKESPRVREIEYNIRNATDKVVLFPKGGNENTFATLEDKQYLTCNQKSCDGDDSKGW